MNSKRSWRHMPFMVLVGLIALILPSVIMARTIGEESNPPQNKIETLVLEQLDSESETDFFIWMEEKADLGPASNLPTKEAKGAFVLNALRETSERSQSDLRTYLDAQGVRYHSFYIANKILVTAGTESLVMSIANRPDVAKITANHAFQLQEPFINLVAPESSAAIEPNITFINADDVWAMGFTGQGTVMAGLDTGLQWDHPAIINHYRGWNGSSANHNYNWWDSTGTYPSAPGDGHGHGTHTTGTMVGDDGGANQIGVAPGAETIHCKGMDDGGGGSVFTFSQCFEFFLAPWDLSGNNPNPSLAPDAINNSWGFWGGGVADFQDEIAALQAAGIAVEVSAGNEGSSCQTLRSPGDYGEVLTTGSVNHASGSLPGTLTGFSSRGPSTLSSDFFPDIMAPGENIRSSVPGSGYQGGWSGTSMSGPHVTALIGLMWSANPGLRGLINETYQIIADTAVPLTGQTGSNCGGNYTTGPNHDWGVGTINALTAVNTAILYGNPGTLNGTVTDSVTANPLPGAHVAADRGDGIIFQTNTDAVGFYSTIAFSGTYTVSVSKFGYFPQTHPGIQVTEFQTTTLNVQLVQAPSFTVSGTVTDATTGWPLYAQINIGQGFPDNPIWTDPLTGDYSVVLPAGTYDFAVSAFVAGYDTSTVQVTVSGNTTQDFALDANLFTCTAPGYTAVPSGSFSDNFESGYGNWTMSGLWNPESQANTCGSLVAPFPSPTNAAYYGVDGLCTYNNGSANSGTMTLNSPISVGPGSILSYWSYEQTECNGNCGWDARQAQISTDGGATWSTVIDGDTENVWHQRSADISAYAGSALLRFRFDTGDGVANDYFGWMVDNVNVTTYTCVPPASGGLVVGNVYDVNTSDPVVGAWVTNETGSLAYAMATPLDPAVDDALYTIYSLSGSQVHTATYTLYGEDVQTVNVVDDDTVEQDFYLPSGFVVANPTNFDVTLELGDNTTLPLALIDTGGANVEFEIREVPGTNPYLSLPLHIPASDGNFLRGSHPTSLGAASQSDGQPAGPVPGASLAQLLGSNAYGVEHSSAYYTIFDIDVPEVLPFVSAMPPTSGFIGAGEYVNGMVYMIDTNNTMWEVDAATGAIQNTYSATPPGGGETYSGLAYDPTSGVVYAGTTNCGNSSLYTIDPPTGVATLVGAISNGGCLIALAADGNGDLWGYDIIADVLLWIDKNTGAGTIIGSIGFDANFGQGMGWDPDTDTLYMAAFNGSAFQPELRAVDRSTGNTTLMGVLGQTTPGGTPQVSWLGFAISEMDVPWVSEDPITGTVPANGSFPVDVTFDAAQVPIPGQYTAQLKIVVDAPQLEVYVPLTLTVTCATCGTLQGNITDAATTLPLVGSVQITSTGGFDFTLEDVSFYTIQLGPGQYFVTASSPGYLSDTAVVNITTGNTTVQDFALWADTAILSYSPASVEEFMEIGDVVSNTVTVNNTGAAPLEFEVRIGGYSGPFLLRPVGQNGTTTTLYQSTEGVEMRANTASGTAMAYPSAYRWLPALPAGGNILVYADDPMHIPTHVESALQALGLAYTLHNNGDFTGFETSLNSGAWDLVIFANDNFGAPSTTLTALNNYVLGGGKLIAHTWGVGFDTLNPLWATLGFTWMADDTDPPDPVYWWDDAHPIFTDPNDVPEFTSLDGAIFGTYGQHVEPLSGFEALAGYTTTPAPNQAAMVLGNDSRTVFRGFLDGQNSADLDSDGLPDGRELWINLISGIETGFSAGPQWAYAVPDSGTVPGFSSTTFELVFDARSMYQVGDFYATLSFRGNFVNVVDTMPLTMHLSCPTCGFLNGDITDAWTNDPLTADIHVTGPGGFDVMLSGDSYALAVQPGTYDFEVTADGYFVETASVTVAAGQTVVTDFALTPIVAILEYSPASYEHTLAIGQVLTDSLILNNTGTAAFDFELSDRQTGSPFDFSAYTPSALPVGTQTPGLSELLDYGNSAPQYPTLIRVPAQGGDLLLDQQPSQANGIFSDVSCDLCGGAQVLADNFAFSEEHTIGGINIWSGYFPADVPVPDNITVIFHEDSGGLPGATISTETAVPASRVQTGVILFGVHEYFHTLTLNNPVTLGPGTYWVEIYNDTGFSTDDFFWETGNQDNNPGTPGSSVFGSAFAFSAPGSGWNQQGDDLAIQLLEGSADALWLHEDPATGTVNAGESETVNIIFDASVITQTGTYTAEIRFAGTFDNSVPPAQVVMHVIASAVYGVDVSADPDALAGDPGTTVAYTVDIANTGNVADTYNLTLSGNGWNTTLSTNSITVGAGETDSVTVWVDIPANASGNDMDVVTVTATSANDAAATDSVDLTTSLATVYGVAMSGNMAATGAPGHTVMYAMTITNTGNTTDTFNLVFGAHTWTATLPDGNSLTLAAGASATVMVHVAIPTSASAGQSDAVALTATSTHDSSATASATLTTTAGQTIIYLPIILKP
ncbi:MAG TPA: S8 family serine peptidase [Chloroflexota bacterium]|nr:S8 family serine peptidase [Chloroflexota bacterium]